MSKKFVQLPYSMGGYSTYLATGIILICLGAIFLLIGIFRPSNAIANVFSARALTLCSEKRKHVALMVQGTVMLIVGIVFASGVIQLGSE